MRFDVWFIGIAALFAGCTTTTPEFRLLGANASPAGAAQWPSAPEPARYRFAGELLGERNFSTSSQQRSSVARLLRAVVGLDDQSARPQTLVRPQSGLVDAHGRVLVTDVGAACIFVFDLKAGRLSVWSQADEGAGFITPLGIAEGPHEEIHVSDPGLGRVVRLSAAGEPVGSYGDGVLRRPTGIVHDPEHGLTYVADSGEHDIKVFDAEQRLIRTLGGPGTAAGRFNGPTFLAMSAGRLVVSDTLNARIQVLEADGRPVRQIGQRGLYVGNLVRPKGVAADKDGNVYIVESYFDYLLVYNERGDLLLPIGGTGNAPGKFFLPGGVWSDRDDRIFVADVFNARVVVFQYLGN